MSKRKIFWGLVCSFVVYLAVAPSLFAQAADRNGAPAPFHPMAGRFGFAPTVTGAPFSATRTITHVQALSNGTTITHTTVVNESRDSNGRTYTASTTNGSNFTSYHVLDPVSRVSISWNSNTKEAHLTHLPDPSQFHGRNQANGEQGSGTQDTHGSRRNGVQPEVEDLGTKSIAGVPAVGTLTTRTIPAGKIGNSEPLVSTHESWRSSDLKIEIERTDTDPRDGTTTVESTNVNRDEPAATLFAVPAGYTTVTNQARGPRP